MGGGGKAKAAAAAQAEAMRQQTAMLAAQAEQQRADLAAERTRNEAESAARTSLLQAQQAAWEAQQNKPGDAAAAAEAEKALETKRRGRASTIVAGGAGAGESLGNAAQAPSLKAVLG